MGQIRIIGGKWRGRQIPVIAQKELRPTPDRVRETLFNWLMQKVEGTRCLDLFAGTGILGFEALSRGAKQVVFIEKHPASVRHLKDVAEKLHTAENCDIQTEEALTWLQKHSAAQSFDIIFLDPPYASSLLEDSLRLLAKSNLVLPHTWLYIESDKALPPGILPPHWQILKQKQAGEVVYHLVQGGCL